MWVLKSETKTHTHTHHRFFFAEMEHTRIRCGHRILVTRIPCPNPEGSAEDPPPPYDVIYL